MVYWKFAVLGAPCIFLFSHITGAFVRVMLFVLLLFPCLSIINM